MIGNAGPAPYAHACCGEHMQKRVVELRDWQARNGATGCPVILPRESGGESFYLDVKARQ